jgi:hypothetical protein
MFEPPTDNPRELTDDEVKERFLQHVRNMVRYWASEGASNVEKDKPIRARLEGLAHSILVAIDGSAMALPAFALVPQPHPDDKEYARAEGRNWYPPCEREIEHDIAGTLHDCFYTNT